MTQAQKKKKIEEDRMLMHISFEYRNIQFNQFKYIPATHAYVILKKVDNFSGF